MNTTQPTDRFRRWARRATVVAAALGLSIAIAAPAQAYIPPGPTSIAGTPGAYEATLICGPGQIYLQPSAAVLNGYYGGQWVTYHYALWGSNGMRAWTSAWAAAKAVPYSVQTSAYVTTFYPRMPLPALNAAFQRGVYWEVAVQYGWYVNGVGWQYSSWTTPDGYNAGYLTGNPAPRNGTRTCNT